MGCTDEATKQETMLPRDWVDNSLTFCWWISLSSLLVVRWIDDDATQRVSLCRRMWLLFPKAGAQTRPHTVQADPCRLVVGGGGLRWWCLWISFASATSICCCSNVASPSSQTARHSSRSLANSSSLSKEIPHLLMDDLMQESSL